MRIKSHGSREYKVADVIASWNTAFTALPNVLYSFHLYKPDTLTWSSIGIAQLDGVLNTYYNALPRQHAHPDHESGSSGSEQSCWFCREAKRVYAESVQKSLKYEVNCLLKRVEADTSGMWRNMALRGKTKLSLNQENVLKTVIACKTSVKSDVYKQVYKPFLRALSPLTELADISEEVLKNKDGVFCCKVRFLRMLLPNTMKVAASDADRKVKINTNLSEDALRKGLVDKVVATLYTPQEAGRVLAHAEVLKLLRRSCNAVRALTDAEAELGVTRLDQY